MVESIQEIFLILGRILTIIPLLLFMTIFMGKRAIGEIPIFDFLIVIILGAVVGADIADPDIHHFPTALAVVFIAILQRLVARLKVAHRLTGRLITFEPTVVIQNGKMINQNLKKIRYSIDNLMQMLREKDVFDIAEVETAVVEANGSLSVLKIPEKQAILKEDIRLNREVSSSLALPVIIEGQIDTKVLAARGLNEIWLHKQLETHDIKTIEDIFFASVNAAGELHISKYNERSLEVPVIRH
ncbi:DUF421 domain-containing protein [Salipaludibacillus aurantiacus]|uniref:Uncharacterized membrane protein YcaP, DUF421 family n=1 Tax=Salipaludibacillus aurantiacus TaxID=1601833 RepID=A0A1H9VJG3_9BACI|nr:DUF421 domain-containing protein [Salipaludibacillus aurantiacus]SES21477.1 Uncharacterized membrane protein YcaP, DUF421 family [Salipaludibacillus aurantiacus]